MTELTNSPISDLLSSTSILVLKSPDAILEKCFSTLLIGITIFNFITVYSIIVNIIKRESINIVLNIRLCNSFFTSTILEFERVTISS